MKYNTEVTHAKYGKGFIIQRINKNLYQVAFYDGKVKIVHKRTLGQ